MGFRKASNLRLREDHLPIGGHVEDSALAANQLALDARLISDRSRQTGGSGEIVSLPAVRDAYPGRLHGFSARHSSFGPAYSSDDEAPTVASIRDPPATAVRSSGWLLVDG